jgi:hypothetical protein
MVVGMPDWRKLAAGCAAIAWLAGAPAAHAQDWRPVPQSCISFDGSGGQCSPVRSGTFMPNILVAPGGTTAYVASEQIFGGSNDALLIFNRDPATGKLTQRAGKAGCISQDGTGGQCDTSRLLGNFGGAMALSPGGKQLYVLGGGAVLVFNVLAGGALAQKPGKEGCITNDGSDFQTPNVCTDARGMLGPVNDLALSPDGKTLYVSGTQLAAFNRNATTGVLTQLPAKTGCSAPGAPDGCEDVIGGFAQGDQISVSPDGRSLYVANGRLLNFDRATATGALTQKPGAAGCITSDGSNRQCQTEARISTATAALTSPDGRQVYVSTGDGVLTYARAGDGTVALQSCINDRGTTGCQAGFQLSGLTYSAISPDGQDLVASTQGGGDFDPGFPGGIVSLVRNSATGDLSQRPSVDACVTNDGSGVDEGQLTINRCIAMPVASAPGRIAFANDGQFYAGASLSTGLVAYKRDFYPTCADRSFSAGHDALTPLQLSCGDRNGDPLTVQVSASPVSGTLGGVDQAGQRVTYIPFPGFSGSDSFRYRALAGGLTSSDATVSLSIAAAAAPAVPPGGGGSAAAATPIDADHDGFFSGQDCNDHDAKIHPGARELGGNKVDENCDGLAEALPTLTAGVSTNWDVDHKRFTLRRLLISTPPRGAKLEILCMGKHCPFKRHPLSGKVRRGFLNAIHSLGRKVHFRAKQTLEVRISKPGFNTKVAQLKLLDGRIPTTTPLCLPPGATRPQRTCE